MLQGGLAVHGWARGAVAAVLLSAVVLAVPASAFAGSISGDVTDAGTHGPISGVRVCAVEEDFYGSFKEFCTHSGLDGHYSISPLPGKYVVEFLPGAEGLNYVYQAWEGKRVPYLADPVEVGSSDDVAGIDAELVEGGRIGGRVVSAGNGSPLADVEVCAEPGGLENVDGCAVTDALGEYTIVGLGTDTYLVQFFPPEEAEFLEQYYDHEPGILEADDVEVVAGSLTPNVDAELQEAGQITGTITDALTHAPLQGVDACAWEATGGGYLGQCGESDAAGHYKIRRVPAGAYHVSFNQFRHAPAYAIQWYRCSNGRPATPVNVAAGVATSGIDAGLVERWDAPCESTSAPTDAAATPAKFKKVRFRCRKGFHRKRKKGRVRCVRKKKHHHRRRHVRPHGAKR